MRSPTTARGCCLLWREKYSSSHALWCTLMHSDVLWCTLMYSDALWCNLMTCSCQARAFAHATHPFFLRRAKHKPVPAVACICWSHQTQTQALIIIVFARCHCRFHTLVALISQAASHIESFYAGVRSVFKFWLQVLVEFPPDIPYITVLYKSLSFSSSSSAPTIHTW